MGWEDLRVVGAKAWGGMLDAIASSAWSDPRSARVLATQGLGQRPTVAEPSAEKPSARPPRDRYFPLMFPDQPALSWLFTSGGTSNGVESPVSLIARPAPTAGIDASFAELFASTPEGAVGRLVRDEYPEIGERGIQSVVRFVMEAGRPATPADARVVARAAASRYAEGLEWLGRAYGLMVADRIAHDFLSRALRSTPALEQADLFREALQREIKGDQDHLMSLRFAEQMLPALQSLVAEVRGEDREPIALRAAAYLAFRFPTHSLIDTQEEVERLGNIFARLDRQAEVVGLSIPVLRDGVVDGAFTAMLDLNVEGPVDESKRNLELAAAIDAEISRLSGMDGDLIEYRGESHSRQALIQQLHSAAENVRRLPGGGNGFGGGAVPGAGGGITPVPTAGSEGAASAGGTTAMRSFGGIAVVDGTTGPTTTPAVDPGAEDTLVERSIEAYLGMIHDGLGTALVPWAGLPSTIPVR